MSEELDLPPIPDRWIWTSLAEISEKISPGFPSGKHNKESRGVLHFRPMNISTSGNIDLSVTKFVEKTDYDPILRGDIIFNNTNSPELVGKSTYVKQDTDWAYSNHMTKIRVNTSLIDPAWIATYLNTLYLQGFFKIRCTNHVNQASINSTYLGQKVPIPLPPNPEQKRIVTKIEELFTQLDAGVASLKRVQAQLKRYRQAVLKDAFEGKLTQEWRVQHTGKIEPADVLIKRIIDDPTKSSKDKQTSVLIDDDLASRLPQCWNYASIAQISEKIVDCPHSTPKYGSGDALCVDTTCIEPCKLVFEKLRRVDIETFNERNRRLVPIAGDIIFAREGTIGTAVVLPDTPHVCLGQRVMLIRTSKLMSPKYVCYAIMSPQIQRSYKSKILGSTVPHINVGDVIKFRIPVSSRVEQEVIVSEIERLFSIADEVEHTIENSLKLAESLRQSILKRAFEGKLAPQDPTDEPASILLERIKAEKAQTTAEVKKSKKTQTKSPTRKIKHGN